MRNMRPTLFHLNVLPQARHALMLILPLLFFTVNAMAQTTTTTTSDRTTPLGLKAGAAAGSYSLSDLENINLYNGNLTWRLPLVNMGGRGTAGHTVMLALNTKKWNVKTTQTQTSETWAPTHSFWGSPYTGYLGGKLEGRKSGFGLKNITWCGPYPPNTRIFETTLTTLTFTTADGTEYDLRDELSGGQRLAVGSCPAFVFPYNGQTRGRVFVSADGSAATFTSDTDIYDRIDIPQNTRTFKPSGYLVLRDGTRYRIDAGQVSWIRDRNGNKMTFLGGVTDSLGRSITLEQGVSDPTHGLCDRIGYKGFGGVQRFTYVTWTNLANALRMDQTTKTLSQLFPELGGGSGSYNPSVVSSVVLPDGRSYQFRYNSYGELARVVLPTGGAVEYDMVPGSGVVIGSNGQGDMREIYRRVAERRTYANGADPSTLTNRTVYTPSASGGFSVRVEQFAANGTLLTSSKHYFHGDPAGGLFQQIEWDGSPVELYPSPLAGHESKSEVYDTNGVSATTLLQTVTNTWEAGTTLGGFPINPRVSAVTTTLHDLNLVSKKTFSYDQCTGCNPYFNNQTDVYEYDFGSGAPGALMRRSHTDYLVTNPVNGVDYTRHDNNIHLRSLPAQQSVYDAGGTEKARTTFEYDNYASDGSHAPLTNRSSISGFDGAFTTSYQTRGNLTKTTSWILSTGTPLSGYAQYDIAGNAVKAIDARGYAATFDFTDRFGGPDGEARANSGSAELNALGQYSYAFPTLITNALGHTAYTQFDYYLGQPVDGEDANGVVASGYFNDALDRPTTVIRAANQGASVRSQTSYSYDAANHIITTTSDLNTYGDNLLKSQALYDGLGRTTETRAYEGGTNYIAVQTQYDALGRTFKMTNPFRPWQSESAVWTTTAFDALGRMRTVTTPDSAVVNTNYSGNTVTVTDQAGKARKSVTDGLGRLKEVYEAPNDPNYNYLTSYSYDVLDNLTTVSQGAQTRTFAYDSLKRLTSAYNPESGTINYSYDVNGNLLSKTDARITTSYVYDALNRVTTILYRVNGQPDPNTGDVEYLYDNATNGKGRLWLTFKWGANPFQKAVGGYDALGRVTQLHDLFGNGQGGWYPAYTSNRTHDLAGNVTSQTYPSGRTVSYSYDSAGRTSSFTGNLGDGISRTYATGITYSPFGGTTREQYGTDITLYQKSFYNIRGQLFDVRLSSVNDTWDWNRGRLIFYYAANHGWGQSGTDNNGNLLFAQHWVPPVNAGLDQGESLIEESYTYDSLNRLSSVSESSLNIAGGGSWVSQFAQAYSYDRYGNRTINAAQTWASG